MRTPLAVVLGAVLAPATTHGALTNLFSTSSLAVEAEIESRGIFAAGPAILDFFRLNEVLAIDEARSTSAMLPNASTVSADASAVHTLSAGNRSARIAFDSTANANLNATNGDTFGFVKARTAHITRFITDSPIEVHFRGLGAFGFNLLGDNEPFNSQTFIRIIDETDVENPIFTLREFEQVNERISLPVGRYQIQIAVDSTFQLFGFPPMLYESHSALNLTASVRSIPAPGTLGAGGIAGVALARRRR